MHLHLWRKIFIVIRFKKTNKHIKTEPILFQLKLILNWTGRSYMYVQWSNMEVDVSIPLTLFAENVMHWKSIMVQKGLLGSFSSTDSHTLATW